jgi:hypothetical protein
VNVEKMAASSSPITNDQGLADTTDHPQGMSRHVNVPWLALPSGSCCLKGHMHVGDPRGSFETIAGVDTYVSRPAEGKANGHILFYYADVYGLFTNAQLIMDEYADESTACLDR